MRFVLLAGSLAFLAGCGYVGDPLPPALNIPAAVSDLRAFQRGDKIILDFTAPALTTEAVGITSFLAAEVEIGESSVPAPPPTPGMASRIELPANRYVGNQIGIRLFLTGPKGRRSDPSNVATLRVVAALSPPADVKAEPHPEGVRVSWTDPDKRATQYRITRVPEASATVDRPEYIDRTVEMGNEYKYSVVAIAGTAESLTSGQESVIAKDNFSPSTPANLTAIAGVNTIEIAWDRSPEPDLKAYRVYRNDQLLGEVESPSFSDKQVKTGEKYRYSVSAVDVTGNESARSAVIEVAAQ